MFSINSAVEDFISFQVPEFKISSTFEYWMSLCAGESNAHKNCWLLSAHCTDKHFLWAQWKKVNGDSLSDRGRTYDFFLCCVGFNYTTTTEKI